MNTLKRMQALGRRQPAAVGGPGMGARRAEVRALLPHPACAAGTPNACAHTLADGALNAALFRYERLIRGRFDAIEEVLRALSPHQHDVDFAERAQRMAEQRLGLRWPQQALEHAWVSGVDMKTLFAHATFEGVARCVASADEDQAAWRNRLPLQAARWHEWGYHTVDISPCADGRLQGLLPFVLRTVPDEAVLVKAYAGALFDVEDDLADWAQRQLRQSVSGAPALDYLKVAVYHFSSSSPTQQGCAAHGSHDAAAIAAAIDRLYALRQAVAEQFGPAMAPPVVLIGVDTDLDAIRIHLPDAMGRLHPERFLDSARLYRETLGLPAPAARQHIEQAVAAYEHDLGGLSAKGNERGLRAVAAAWLEANLSQIEYVIHHHAGRYAVIGHDEQFICVGDMVPRLHLRNQFYYAHLDTVEEGAADLDVGVHIFTGLNVRRGLPVPVLVHLRYSSAVPDSRQRALQRGQRIRRAIAARYAELYARGLLHCRVAVSDRLGREPLAFVPDDVAGSAAH